MNDSYKAYVALLGRVLLALMFIQSGFDKWLNISGTAAYIASAGLPLPSVLAVLAAALELFGGIALVLGFQVRLVGLAMALFTLVAAFVFHAYWAVPADQTSVMQLLFMKNVSVAGGLLLVSALGGGPLSVGARREALQ
jgi:putative oxidoreductase